MVFKTFLLSISKSFRWGFTQHGFEINLTFVERWDSSPTLDINVNIVTCREQCLKLIENGCFLKDITFNFFTDQSLLLSTLSLGLLKICHYDRNDYF